MSRRSVSRANAVRSSDGERSALKVIRFAQETDLLLLEATLPRPERDGTRGHLTPSEAGEHGRAANAKKLVLTHISDELDHLWARNCATEAFGRDVEVAAEGATYDV